MWCGCWSGVDGGGVVGTRSALRVAKRCAGGRHLSAVDIPQGARVFTVVVHGAQHVPTADLNGLADPYVRLSLGRQMGLTTTQKGQLNPQWRPAESFSFVVESKDYHCVLELFDADKYNRDDLLGATNFILSDFGPQPSSLRLSLVQPDTGVAVESCRVAVAAQMQSRDQFLTEIEVLAWEYERHNGLRWGKHFTLTDPNGGKCHYSDYHSTIYAEDVDEVTAPELAGVEGLVKDPWGVVNSFTGSDDQGWQYSFGLKGNRIFGWNVSPGPLTFVRRRLWRKVVKVQHAR